MKKTLSLLFLTSIIGFGQYGQQDPLRAFPTAYGGGALATGARADLANAQLVIVNTTNVSTPLTSVRPRVWQGGIESALTDDIGPRFVVFNVSGVFTGTMPQGSGPRSDQSSAIYNATPFELENMTVFGQSAPEGGVNITRTFIYLVRQQNIIMRHITSRPDLITGDPIGDDTKSTGIYIGGNRIMVDHCSSSWGGDKAIIVGDWQDGYPMINNTIQKSLAADSATLMFMVDGRNVAPDWNIATNVSNLGNLMMGDHRTPNMGGFEGYGEIKNNLVLGDGPRFANITRASPRINHMNNYYRAFLSGTYRPNVYQRDNAGSGASTDMEIYSFGNYFEDNDGVISTGLNLTANQERDQIWTDFSGNPVDNSLFVSTEHTNTTTYQWPLVSATQARLNVLADVGHNRYMQDDGSPGIYQDTYDLAAITDATNGVLNYRDFSSDWIMPTIPTNTRPASYDTDNDGMADVWEIQHYGNLSQDFYEDFDGDGVANIEEFMNQIDLASSPPPSSGSSSSGSIIQRRRVSN